jgi:NAD(P)-dependent dehydrogenase (short-subunit alcohol dehydrogenase family)
MTSERKVVLVSGASKGIGRAIATELHHAGCRVFGTSRAAQPEPVPGVEMLSLDVQDERSVQRCIDQLIIHAGRVDVLVNNAGFDLYGALEETSLAEFSEQIDVNLMGPVRLIKAALPHMRQQGQGQIINVGSLGGRIGLPMNSAYAASKFALEGLTQSLRLELHPLNISVSIVAPGAVSTDTLDSSIREVRHPVAAYLTRRAALVAQMRADGANSSVSPKHVAHAVCKLVRAASPVQSQPVGLQAVMVPLLKAYLPQRLFEAMLKRIFP